MRAVESRKMLEELIRQANLRLDTILPEQLIKVFLDFYANQRSEDCQIDTDGDMLLFQWGIYESILGPNFHLSMTRQFAVGGDDDAELYQLELDLEYLPTEALVLAGSGNRWCERPEKGQMKDFDEFIRNSLAFQSTRGERPVNVTLDYSCVC